VAPTASQGAVPSSPPVAAPTASQGAVPSSPPVAAPTASPGAAPASSAVAARPPPRSSIQSVAPEVAEAILGQPVIDPKGKEIGRLVDVLVDAKGEPQAAVIDFGGFMGVGNRKVAVHWSVLHFNPGDAKYKVTLVMTPDQLKAAPEFLNSNKAAPVVTPTNITATAH
jgi:hypothetical protein